MTDQFARTLQNYAVFLSNYAAQSEANETTYKKVLEKNKEEIISALGGLDIIIKLCLTNIDGKDEIDAEKFAALQSTINKELKCFHNNTTTHDDSLSFGSELEHASPASMTSSPSNDMIAHNLPQFCRNSIIFVADSQNNFYFKYCNYTIANFIFYKVLLTKWYPLVSMLGGTIVLCLSVICFDLNYHHTGTLFAVLGGIISIVFWISCILCVNFDIFYLTMRRFGFWFKVYNLVVYIISVGACLFIFKVTPHQEARADIIVSILLTVLAYFWACILDGIPISPTIKESVIVLLLIQGFVSCSMTYFTFDEAYWNPFESYGWKHSRIDFKSVFLSAAMNLVIFTAKPILSDIGAHCASRLCNTNPRRRHAHSQRKTSYDRCYNVYTRPYLHWKNRTYISHEERQVNHQYQLFEEL